jgi:hypothetical protein
MLLRTIYIVMRQLNETWEGEGISLGAFSIVNGLPVGKGVGVWGNENSYELKPQEPRGGGGYSTVLYAEGRYRGSAASYMVEGSSFP